jgi:hypothetical protein
MSVLTSACALAACMAWARLIVYSTQFRHRERLVRRHHSSHAGVRYCYTRRLGRITRVAYRSLCLHLFLRACKLPLLRGLCRRTHAR